MEKVRVMVVEDERIVAADIQQTLEDLGYEVASCVASGDEALRRAALERPDLVLMDIKLQGEMDGIEAAARIRERFGTPVIYLTAFADEAILERAKVTEPFGYIIKPFDDRQLHTAMEMALYKHKAEKRIRQREEALGKTYRWLQTLVQAIPDVVFFKDAQGRHVVVNRACQEILGMREEDITGKTVEELFPPDFASQCRQGDEEVMRKGVPVRSEEHSTGPDGGKRTLEMIKVPLYDEEGNATGLIGIGRDVTERKKVEDRLRLYLEGIESAPDGVQIVNMDGIVEYSNKAVEEIYGYTVEELRGRHVNDMNVDPHIADREILPAIRQTGRWTGEIMVRHKDGREFPIWLSASLVRNEKGEPIAMVGIDRDITERKSAEQELKRHREHLEELVLERSAELVMTNELLRREITERREAERAKGELLTELKTIFDNLPLGIIYLDADFKHLSMNRFACDLTGMNEEELIGKPCYETLGEYADDPSRTATEKICSFCMKDECFRTGKPVVMERNLGDRIIRVATVPEMDEQGNIHRFLEIIEDVSERVRAEKERAGLEQQPRHSQKMEAVGQLAGGVAHEFNNRLTAITNCGYILKMKLEPDEPLRVYAEQILASAEKAASLTQSLLAFSRKQVINPKAVRVNDIVRGVEKFLHRVIGADIELVTGLLDEDLTVLADVGQIEQVLLNMATNARDAMPGGGYLHIDTERVNAGEDPSLPFYGGGRGSYAVISVSDTGEGMEESRREKIFEPFFTTKGVGKGTGLGLSIAYGIIKQHGGHITVQSEPGEGTTFRIFIPLTESEAGEAKPSEAPVPEGGRETVLLAEDDADVRRFTRQVLEEFGYRVIEAVDGDEAIRAFRENRDSVSLLLTDVVMPKKSGKEVYREIRRESPGIRSLFISGYAADIINGKGMLEEGLHFITKPVSPGELLRRVREELDRV